MVDDRLGLTERALPSRQHTLTLTWRQRVAQRQVVLKKKQAVASGGGGSRRENLGQRTEDRFNAEIPPKRRRIVK